MKIKVKLAQRRAGGRNRKWVVVSLDVKALYPSLKIEESAKIVSEIVRLSGIEVDGADWKEIGKYLAINMNWEEVEELELEEVVPKRISGGGRKVTMAYFDGGKNNVKNELKWEKFWRMPLRAPNPEEKSRMISKAVLIGIKTTMFNHHYLVGEEIRRQLDGGPIGSELQKQWPVPS